MIDNRKFDEYYSKIYGYRWPDLAEALKWAGQKTNKVLLGDARSLKGEWPLVFRSGSLACFKEGPVNSYQVDLASVLAVSSLGLTPEARVLDLCSAPGGKALTSQYIVGGQGEWHLNELSQGRLSRLKSVMREFSPARRDQLNFYKRDASKWGLAEKCIYDFVLCDVPCSGEAHLLNTPSYLKRWTPKSSKNLTVRQHAILCAALEAVKPGGKILYSTCSVNPQENDGVVAKFLKKRSDRARVGKPDVDDCFQGEATEYGIQYFPDISEIGPIYFCILEKVY